MKSLRGATLLEALISTGVFSLLALAVFVLFHVGQLKWNVMYLRHHLQNDVRKSVNSLERDLRKTDFSSVDVYAYPFVIPQGWPRDVHVPRWAICMVGLDDWSKSANFDPARGTPLWNQYNLYMATTQEFYQGVGGPVGGAGSGQFLQITLKFDASSTHPLPLHFPLFVDTVLNIDWGLNNEYASINPLELLSGFGFDSIPGDKIAKAMSGGGSVGNGSSIGTGTIGGGSVGGSTGSTGGGVWGGNQNTPNSFLDGARNYANTNDFAGLTAYLTTQINDSLSKASAPSPLHLTAIDIKTLGTVFAFSVDKNFSMRNVGYTLKTKGNVYRSEEQNTGFDSRQVDGDVTPQVSNSK